MRPAFRALFLCLLLLTGACRSNNPTPAQTDVSLWYWHTPFRISPAESQTLERLKVRELFVRAATLTFSGDEKSPVRAVLPQVWKTRPMQTVTLVFPVEASLVRRLEMFDEDVFADAVTGAIRAEQARAAAASGIRVTGAQIDLDCPTRLLPRYARVLARIKRGLTVPLSITLLTSWLDSRNLPAVLDAVDFSVPQFYEAETATTHDKFHPISSPARFRRGLQKAGRLGKPFYAGVPVYGHALVYDGQGRLRGLYHDAGAADRMNRPDEFKFREAVPLDAKGQAAATPADFIGEERVEFGPARADAAFSLVFDLPTPEMLARHLVEFQKERPRNCRGIILYRFPEAGEESVLPLATVAAVMEGRTPRPDLHFSLRTRRHAPYALVEADDPKTVETLTYLYVTVTNTGDGMARIGPDTVEVDLHFSRAALESAQQGGFDRVTGFAGQPENRASIPRADGLRVVASRLAPGEKRVIGPIALLPGPTVTVSADWRVTLPSGFETVRGTLPVTPVPSPEKESK